MRKIFFSTVCVAVFIFFLVTIDPRFTLDYSFYIKCLWSAALILSTCGSYVSITCNTARLPISNACSTYHRILSLSTASLSLLWSSISLIIVLISAFLQEDVFGTVTLYKIQAILFVIYLFIVGFVSIANPNSNEHPYSYDSNLVYAKRLAQLLENYELKLQHHNIVDTNTDIFKLIKQIKIIKEKVRYEYVLEHHNILKIDEITDITKLIENLCQQLDNLLKLGKNDINNQVLLCLQQAEKILLVL